MCWMGVTWPQTICSRVRPKTVATASRSAGLGVQRPVTIARTRDSSSPLLAASSGTVIPFSAHKRATVWPLSIVCSLHDPVRGPGIAPAGPKFLVVHSNGDADCLRVESGIYVLQERHDIGVRIPYAAHLEYILVDVEY